MTRQLSAHRRRPQREHRACYKWAASSGRSSHQSTAPLQQGPAPPGWRWPGAALAAWAAGSEQAALAQLPAANILLLYSTIPVAGSNITRPPLHPSVGKMPLPAPPTPGSSPLLCSFPPGLCPACHPVQGMNLLLLRSLSGWRWPMCMWPRSDRHGRVEGQSPAGGTSSPEKPPASCSGVRAPASWDGCPDLSSVDMALFISQVSALLTLLTTAKNKTSSSVLPQHWQGCCEHCNWRSSAVSRRLAEEGMESGDVCPETGKHCLCPRARLAGLGASQLAHGWLLGGHICCSPVKLTASLCLMAPHYPLSHMETWFPGS